MDITKAGDSESPRTSDYDVIVVGGGAAGLMATIRAAESGARVCLVEAGDKLGGSTVLSGGVIFAADTSVMRESNVADSVSAMTADCMETNRGTADAEVVERVAEESRKVVEWLRSRGVVFERYDSAPIRSHFTQGYGVALVANLEGAISDLGIDVALRSRVSELMVDSTGRVLGVVVDGSQITAHAVILASGGFGANFDMMSKRMPRSKYAGDWLCYVGGAHNMGDGIVMGEAVGGAYIGDDQVLLATGNGFHRTQETLIPAWLLVVNELGERFGNEYSPYWVLPELVRAQPNQHAYAILDSRMVLNPRPDRRMAKATREGVKPFSWTTDMIFEFRDKGMVKEADTIAALAATIGAEPAALEQTVARYNALCAQGEDLDYGKPSDDLEPVVEGPFYAVELRNHINFSTFGGLIINRDAQVCRKDGQPIPGLYAAGEVTGNVTGGFYAGTGFQVGSALAMGKVAGEVASRFASEATGSEMAA